jgi:hypothetical protein
MRMAFAQARPVMRTNRALAAELRKVAPADIAHRRAQAAGELVQNAIDRPLVGHLPLDPFRHQLQFVGTSAWK